MADSSFLKVIDEGLRALVWTRFRESLGFDSEDELGDNIVLYPKAVAYRKIAEKRNRNKMEFMNLWRNTTTFSWDRHRGPLARHGLNLAYTDTVGESGETTENTGMVTVKAVPVKLDYSLWFWSKEAEKINQAVEQYMFWIHETPLLQIQYDDLYPIEIKLSFSEAHDESPLDDMFKRGTYFVCRVPIGVEGWILKEVEIKTIKTIIITMYDRDSIVSTSEFLLDPNEDLELYTETITEES